MATWSALDLARILGQFPPTPEQIRVIEAPNEPMLVIAGAGSGKTETMAAKVVYLVANNLVHPSEILGLTFTRKAAAELSERIRARLRTLAEVDEKIDISTPPRISTYNSYAAGIVADHGLRLGLDPESVLISDAGRYQLAEQVVNSWPGELQTERAVSSLTAAVAALAGEISEHGLTTREVRDFLNRTIAEIESKAPEGRSKVPRVEIRNYLERMSTRVTLMDLVDAFTSAKRAAGVIDFGDQVRIAADIAVNVPAAGALERAAYRVVLLDEYQDTSIAQVQLLAALFGGGHPVTAVGDPHQAIYGWRGAAAGTLLEFPRQFATASGPAAIANLSTAWRNSTNILQAANKIALPLRRGADVPELQARDGAEAGEVSVFYGETIDAEAEHIVDYLHGLGWVGAPEHDHSKSSGPEPLNESYPRFDGAMGSAMLAANSDLPNGVDAPGIESTPMNASSAVASPVLAPPSTAILARARKSFAPIAAALTQAGIPHQISGLGGLLSTPEVADLRAALITVHDPSRADVLMRLLTGPRMRIGPRDLNVLSAWARELARNRLVAATTDKQEHTDSAKNTTSPRAQSSADTPTPAGAQSSADTPAPAGTPNSADSPQQAPAPPTVVEDAEAASIVEALQHLPPPHYAPRVAPHPLSAEGRSRLEHLGRQLREIRGFAHLSIPDLVSAAEQILGLDIDVLAARPRGTERDNLDAFHDVATSFIASTRAPDLGGFLEWLSAAEEHERGLDTTEVDPDPNVVQLMTIHAAKGLEWDAVVVAGMGDGLFPSIKESKGGVRRSTGWLGAIDLLPYDLRGDADNLPSFEHDLAATHPEMKEVDEQFQLAEGERLLLEERRLAYVAITRARKHVLLTGSFWMPGRATAYPPSIFLTETTRSGLDIEPVPLQPENHENPLSDHVPEALWPPLLPAVEQPLPRSEPTSGNDPLVEHWSLVAELLLEEQKHEPIVTRAAVEHLSASRVVAAARDVGVFAKNLRRPIPQEPSDRARKGTEFHTWVEQHFNSPTLVDWTLLPGAEDDGTDVDLEVLSASFLASPWAERHPVALEADVETTIAGVRVRSRIDAVFTDDDGAYHVVDWKTGRAPQTHDEERIRMVQLQLYRIAWARVKQIAVKNVRASFYYVAEDLTVAAPELTEAEIVEQIGSQIQEIFQQ